MAATEEEEKEVEAAVKKIGREDGLILLNQRILY